MKGWLAAVVLLAAAVLLWLVPNSPLTRHTLDAPAIVTQVRSMSDLVTVSYTVQQVVDCKEQRGSLGAESILLLVQARVLAGIDLSEITEQDVTIVSRTQARIRLRRPKILQTFLDEKTTKVWDRHITWWTPWIAADPDLEHRARLDALERVKSAAVEMGILTDAQKNAERDIRALLGAFGIQTVAFVAPQT